MRRRSCGDISPGKKESCFNRCSSVQSMMRRNNLKNEIGRKRTDQSFFVPVEEIRKNDYDLSINRYREVEYREIHYDEPKVILGKIKKLEKEIADGIDELGKMID